MFLEDSFVDKFINEKIMKLKNAETICIDKHKWAEIISNNENKTKQNLINSFRLVYNIKNRLPIRAPYIAKAA